MEAPPELIRGEDVLNIPLGTVVASDKGVTFVFAGWRATAAGCEAILVQAYEDRGRGGAWRGRHQDNADPWTYKASIADTLIRKFPGLALFDTRGRDGA